MSSLCPAQAYPGCSAAAAAAALGRCVIALVWSGRVVPWGPRAGRLYCGSRLMFSLCSGGGRNQDTRNVVGSSSCWDTPAASVWTCCYLQSACPLQSHTWPHVGRSPAEGRDCGSESLEGSERIGISWSCFAWPARLTCQPPRCPGRACRSPCT